MQINIPVLFSPAPDADELTKIQAQAVGKGVGIVVASETRDGKAFCNVVFPVYGATFTGLRAEDLAEV